MEVIYIDWINLFIIENINKIIGFNLIIIIVLHLSAMNKNRNRLDA